MPHSTLSPDDRAAGLQRRQLGLVTRRQLLDSGITPGVIDGRVRRGRYRSLLPGVYGDPGLPDSWEVMALAAALWASRDAVLARDSAARLHGLPLPRDHGTRLHLLVRHRHLAVPEGIVVHRSRTLPSAHTTHVGPHPVTSVTRTTIDLATTLGPVALRRLLKAGVRDELTTAIALRAAMREVGPVAGTVRLRALVDELSPLEAQCDSVLESIFLDVARCHGLEPTVMNHPVRDEDGRRRRLDAVYLPERVWAELDSKRFHSTLLDRNDDAMRTNAIERAGTWTAPLRFSWWDVTERPGAVMTQVRTALAAARRTSDPAS